MSKTPLEIIRKAEELQNPDVLAEVVLDIEEDVEEMEVKIAEIKEIAETTKKEKGEQGFKGDKGDKGERGEKGDSGKDGKNGLNGKDGKDGKNGKDGIDGLNGVDGLNGKDGSPDTGEQIVDKINSQGKKIESSKVDLSKFEKDIKELKEKPSIINNIVEGQGGASGIRDIRAGSGIAVSKVNDIYTITNTDPDTTPVDSVINSDGSLTISPTTGNVVASLNLAHSNTFTADQYISNANFTVSEGTITIGNVTSGSATQVNDPSGIFSDDGNTFVWSVYAIKDGVKSATPYIITQSDSGTFSQSFYWHLTWGAVAGADSYLIVVDQDDYNGYYGDFYMETIAPTVTWDYNGTSGDGSIGTPPSYFTSPYITNGIGDFYNVLADKGTIGTFNATTVTASGAIAGGTTGTFGTSVTTPILNVSTLNKSGGSYIDGSSGDVYFKGMGIGGVPGTVNNSLLYMKGSNNGTDHLPLWVFYGEGTSISTLFTTFSNGTSSSAFQLTKARGTIASPLAAQNGDDIGSFRFNIQTGSASTGQSAAFGATVLDIANVYSSMYFGVKDPAGQPTLASNTRFLLEYTASDGAVIRPNNTGTLNLGTDTKRFNTIFGTSLNITKTTEQMRIRYDSSNYFTGTVSSTGVTTFDAVGTDPRFSFSDFVSIGTTLSNATLHVLRNSGEQIRVAYDASNYYSTTVSSIGGVVFDAVGSSSQFSFNDKVSIGGGLYTAVFGDTASTRAGRVTDGTRNVDLADGTYAINATGDMKLSGAIKDTSDVISVDPQNRVLKNGAGTTLLDWNASDFNTYDSTSALSARLDDRQLVASDGITDVIDWTLNESSTAYLSFDDTNIGGSRTMQVHASIEMETGYTIAVAGNNSINPDTRILYASDGSTNMLDWSASGGNGILFNYGGTYNGRLGSSTEAVYAYDGTRYVKLADGTNAILAVGATDLQGSLQVDSIVNDTGLAHGTYTPTITGVTNVTSTTAYQCQYLRVGNTVTVSGIVEVTPTANNTQTTIRISLPISSSISNNYELGGTGHTMNNTTAGHGASIEGDATNDEALFDYYETHGVSDTFSFSFTYLII